MTTVLEHITYLRAGLPLSLRLRGGYHVNFMAGCMVLLTLSKVSEFEPLLSFGSLELFALHRKEVFYHSSWLRVWVLHLRPVSCCDTQERLGNLFSTIILDDFDCFLSQDYALLAQPNAPVFMSSSLAPG